jgi:hypothetical protein
VNLLSSGVVEVVDVVEVVVVVDDGGSTVPRLLEWSRRGGVVNGDLPSSPEALCIEAAGFSKHAIARNRMACLRTESSYVVEV